MPEPQKSTKSRVPQSVIDVIIAVALVASIFVAMFAYTGNWPPLVVIESRSMQHSESESFLGIMDTGDLVLVKSIDSRNDVVTYYQGLARNYKSYGDYGDVIIYLKGGSTQYTPIIHRAVIYLSANPGDDSFRAEELRNLTEGSDYYFVDGGDSWDRITDDLVLHDYGFMSVDLVVPIGEMIIGMHMNGIALHDGFITKGDLNQQVDQLLGISPNRQPVDVSWIVGTAEGEIPWFGILKLWISGDLPSYTPKNSIGALMISIGIIFMLPILAEAYIWWKGEKEEEKMNRASVEMKNDALSDAPLKPDQKMIDSKNEDSGKDTSKLR